MASVISYNQPNKSIGSRTDSVKDSIEIQFQIERVFPQYLSLYKRFNNSRSRHVRPVDQVSEPATLHLSKDVEAQLLIIDNPSQRISSKIGFPKSVMKTLSPSNKAKQWMRDSQSQCVFVTVYSNSFIFFSILDIMNFFKPITAGIG